jgi:hypothetical protein
LQARGIIPSQLQLRQAEEIFRRANFAGRNAGGNCCDDNSMSYPAFVDAVCLAGLLIYSRPKYLKRFPTLEACTCPA